MKIVYLDVGASFSYTCVWWSVFPAIYLTSKIPLTNRKELNKTVIRNVKNNLDYRGENERKEEKGTRNTSSL
jgi:hypothetical protein